MKQKIKEIVNDKFARILDHLYFQEQKSTNKEIMILLFFIQKVNLMLLSNQTPKIRGQVSYFNVCESALFWFTLQKPLQILNSDSVNNIITILYAIIQLVMLVIFCFSTQKWKLISKFSSFYISNFQLLILNHIQIHILTQEYFHPLNILISIPLYINYSIIVYCSRNYFIMTSTILRRYSIYNYAIIFADFISFILFNAVSESIRQYLLLMLFVVYFFDSFFLKPYCNRINIIYVLATSTLVVSSSVKISMIYFSIQDQIYVAFMLGPLISVLIIQLLQISQQSIIHSEFSLELLITLGEFIIDSPSNQILKNIGELLIKKLNPQLSLNSTALLNQLYDYQDSLRSKESNKQQSKRSYYQRKEEIQLYILFLSHNINGSYLQCLLQVKKFQIQNKNASLFFQAISNLLSQKYDLEVQNFGKNEGTQILNHQSLVFARNFQVFYQNNIQQIIDILDQKIRIWNKILEGFNFIDDALKMVLKLHQQINKIMSKHQFIYQEDQQYNPIIFKSQNILVLRYCSFFYSYIKNDFLKTLMVEKQIEQILGFSKDRISFQALQMFNMLVFKGQIAIIGASIVENKGALIQNYTKELNIFFNIQQQGEKKKILYVNQLMPKFLSENHNSYIDEFVFKGSSDLYNKSKLVFGQDGQGFLFPLELSFLHINEKSNDFILTAILKKKLESQNELILFQENGKIIGVTKKAYQLLIGPRVNEMPFQEIDFKICDCYVQFWIPQIMSLISSLQNDSIQKIIKQLIDFYIIDDLLLPQIIFLSKSFSQEIPLNQGYIIQSVQQFYFAQINNTPTQTISLEIEFSIINLPNKQYFYCLQFPNISVSNEILSFRAQENLIRKISPTNQQSDYYQKHLDITEEHFIEQKELLRLENLNSQFINYTLKNQEQLKDADVSFCIKKKLICNQPLSQSSQQTSSSHIQIYETIKQITEINGLNKYVKRIFIIAFILQIILILISATVLNLYYNLNQLLQENVKLVRYPDKFNRLYCSFTTMGQLDLERSLLGSEMDEYVFYRIKELSQSLREQMEDLMPNLRIQFSNLEESNRLPKLNIRIMNYFSYNEETMRMIQFNFLAEAMTDSLNQKILSSLEYSGDEKNLVMDQYFQLQFLKGNLVNQISSSQSLIDSIIEKIYNSNSSFYQTIQIILFADLLLIIFHTFFKIYFWRKSYQSIRLMIQLITFCSDELIYTSISKTQQGKQYIKSNIWKQINYFNTNFRSVQGQKLYYLEPNQTHIKNKNKLRISSRINQNQFQFKTIYLKIFLLMILKFGIILANFIYLTELSTSSQPEMNLTLEYVQFKQDWDSLMILSYLLKTNSVLTQKVLQFGFFDKNEQLKDQNLYFSKVYGEFLESFSQTVPSTQSFNSKILSDIVDLSRMIEADKQKLYNLYENDLCIVLLEELPFCSFKDGKFTYFSEYPTPQTQYNNREIFKGGINGIFQKILEIFQSEFEFELNNIRNTNDTETKFFIQTQDFNLYILQYFFDVNKAVVEFYSTILESVVNILQLDFQNILLFTIVTFAFYLAINIIVLVYYLWNLEFISRASKSSLILLPQECLAQQQCLTIIKKIKEES